MDLFNEIQIKDLKLGDCLVYNKHTFIGRSIQILTRSHYNHTSIYNGNGYVYEATIPKFKLTEVKESYKEASEVLVLKPLFLFNPEILIILY